MKAAIPNALDGIARHQRHQAQAQRLGKVSAVLRQAAGVGVLQRDAFDRSPAYRAQLGELIEIAGRGRVAL